MPAEVCRDQAAADMPWRRSSRRTEGAGQGVGVDDLKR